TVAMKRASRTARPIAENGISRNVANSNNPRTGVMACSSGPPAEGTVQPRTAPPAMARRYRPTWWRSTARIKGVIGTVPVYGGPRDYSHLHLVLRYRFTLNS